MRKIVFRAKTKKDGRWAYGHYVSHAPAITAVSTDHQIHHYISEVERGCVEVCEQTLGQYVGIEDNNGIRIFGGDIVHLRRGHFEKNGIVRYSEHNAQWGIVDGHGCWNFSFFNERFVREYSIVVVGNIHENPDVLEVMG